MKQYEIVWEIFNECARNQMRDVVIEEAFVDDPEAYIRGRHKDKDLILERTDTADGDIIFDIDSSGTKERYTFSEI